MIVTALANCYAFVSESKTSGTKLSNFYFSLFIILAAASQLKISGHYYPNHHYSHVHAFHYDTFGSFGLKGVPGVHHANPSVPFIHYPYPANNNGFGSLQPSNLNPNVLKPSSVGTGWDTIYNIPCGSYTIHPFVIAQTKYRTGSDVRHNQGSRRHRGFDTSWPGENTHTHQQTSCTWQFEAVDSCKLSFYCTWFQLPALFRCEENYIDLTDKGNLLFKFCGNKKPQGSYTSTSATMEITFKSGKSSLPAVFDCAVSCSLESYKKDPVNPAKGRTQTESSTAQQIREVQPVQVRKEEPAKLQSVDCRCGKRTIPSSSTRAIGKNPTFPGEFPWMAAIVKKQQTTPFCAGSLINNRVIITAAHCLHRWGVDYSVDSIEVLLNLQDIKSTDNIARRVGISKIIVHPKYNSASYDHDVGLLYLSEAVNISTINSTAWTKESNSSNILDALEESEANSSANSSASNLIPICLPPMSNKGASEDAIVTGWGLTKEGSKASNSMLLDTVKLFSHSSCKKFYERKSTVSPQMICAGHLKDKTDSCVGDSGGPLIIASEDDKYVLAGIVSFSRGCGRPKLPGVYTKIEGLTEWIQSNVPEESKWCAE